MARITIEDCTEHVPNRFHLVQMTAIRAKQLKKGATPLVQSEDNKEVVVALREIAAGLIAPDYSQPVDEAEDAPMADFETAEPTPAAAADEAAAPEAEAADSTDLA